MAALIARRLLALPVFLLGVSLVVFVSAISSRAIPRASWPGHSPPKRRRTAAHAYGLDRRWWSSTSAISGRASRRAILGSRSAPASGRCRARRPTCRDDRADLAALQIGIPLGLLARGVRGAAPERARGQPGHARLDRRHFGAAVLDWTDACGPVRRSAAVAAIQRAHRAVHRFAARQRAAGWWIASWRHWPPSPTAYAIWFCPRSPSRLCRWRWSAGDARQLHRSAAPGLHQHRARLRVLGAAHHASARRQKRPATPGHTARRAGAPLLNGAVLTETVFSWPGVGTLLLNSIAGPRLRGHPGRGAACSRRSTCWRTCWSTSRTRGSIRGRAKREARLAMGRGNTPRVAQPTVAGRRDRAHHSWSC